MTRGAGRTIEVPGSPGQFANRYWSAVNAPVFCPDGRVVLIAHIGEDVTDSLGRFMSALPADGVYEDPGVSPEEARPVCLAWSLA